MAQVDVSRWIMHPNGSEESKIRKRKLKEEKKKQLRDVKRASLVLNDPNFENFLDWLQVSKGKGDYEQVFDLNFDAFILRGEISDSSSEDFPPFFSFNSTETCKTDTTSAIFLSDKNQKCQLLQREPEKERINEITLKNRQLVDECKNIRDKLLEDIREQTGYIFVRGWSGCRVNTVILKSHCKQDKSYQILKPRCQVKKHHDPDNLKQFNCSSTFSVHFNFKLKTIKLCFCHEKEHDTLPITVIPNSLRKFISTNLCFTARECFNCLKRTPAFSEFTKSFDAKAIVRKIWKEVSQSQWNLDSDPKKSAEKILRHFQDRGELKILNTEIKCSTDLRNSLHKSRPVAFIYEQVLEEIKDDVTEIVIDSTFSLSTDYKQYFVVVASFFGKGVPIGLMATETNEVDYATLSWFLGCILKRLPRVQCINSDWSLAEIKAISALKCLNQICLFHTLTAIRCKRIANKKSMVLSLSNIQFSSVLDCEWVDKSIFDLTKYENKHQEKVSEYQIKEITRAVRIAICDHILLHSSNKDKMFCDFDTESTKVLKLYRYHLKQIYVMVVGKFSLPCYFCYLFNQYYNFASFKLMSRVGKPGFFSVLRTSMMCESYFNQLKSWNLSGSRSHRFDTLTYILLNKELPKIKENIRITKKFEKDYDSTCLVQNHKKYLPTWRKQWIIEWKNLGHKLNSSQGAQYLQECQHYGTDMTLWICGCDEMKISSSSTCIHLAASYRQKYPLYYGYALQRFGKRNNFLPLIQHETLQITSHDKKEGKTYLNFCETSLNSFPNSAKNKNNDTYEDSDLEFETDMISDEKSSECDDETQRKLDTFNFFLADEEMRLLITECPSFQNIMEEMTYAIKRSKKEPQWSAKTNKPEKGFKYDSWIRCLKYYQYYSEIKANGNFPLPL
ncbi:unnamed protein product [Kluyveromyces dobzhanskii CBS 2104]|uniref:WGS project CCBQ000000000 data, contig MAT n=1 Tax=Kluyveromyces dobzhanskii CBS 2104 TaxID=1427455 RepID=A0A0A8L0V8_9SACH|nr:unnamed protein product [Kluyveromyces dobzhanskii CBS 2104]